MSHDYDRRSRTASGGQELAKELSKAFNAGVKSKDDPKEAKSELKAAASELQRAVDSLMSHKKSQLGAPVGIFQNATAAMWEIAYWSGAASNE